MEDQTRHAGQRAPDGDAAHLERACRGRRRLTRNLLARRLQWRRRVVGSMLAGLAAMAATQLAFGDHAAAGVPADTPATAEIQDTACRPAFASAATNITLGGTR